MKRIIAVCMVVSLAVGTLAIPQSAIADNGRDNGRDNARDNGRGNGHGRADRVGRTANCPPGLARRNPPCVPPGQARRGVTTREWMGKYRIGDHVERDDFYYFDEIADLPRLPAGQRYAVLDGNIVALNTETYEILNLIRVLRAITN